MLAALEILIKILVLHNLELFPALFQCCLLTFLPTFLQMYSFGKNSFHQMMYLMVKMTQTNVFFHKNPNIPNLFSYSALFLTVKKDRGTNKGVLLHETKHRRKVKQLKQCHEQKYASDGIDVRNGTRCDGTFLMGSTSDYFRHICNVFKTSPLKHCH